MYVDIHFEQEIQTGQSCQEHNLIQKSARQQYLPSNFIINHNILKMSEDSPTDNPSNHTDSNRRLVSRNFDTFSDENVQLFLNDENTSSADQTHISTHKVLTIKSLTNALNTIETSAFTMIDVEKMTDDFAKLLHNGPVPTPLLITATVEDNGLSTGHNALVSNETLNERAERKRKRDSPEEIQNRIRKKLQQYAYKSTEIGTKNVSFDLQVDTPASQPEISMESTESLHNVTVIEVNQTASTSRTITPPVQVATPLITLEDARNYQVPDNKLHIWKLLEGQLRKVGRHDARVSQLTDDLAHERPPSWCFGGTTAPLHLRPFDDILVNITRAYANTMAAAARQIIFQQAQDDQREANSLLETLRRMYLEDNDPNFELAHKRALGIATHYKEKETQLNRRLHQADIPNQPQTRAEWSECLARRKVSRPNRSRNSRSRSRSPGRRSNSNQRNQPNQPRQGPNQQPPRPNNNNRRQQTQQGQQNPRPPRINNRNQARQQPTTSDLPRHNSNGRNQYGPQPSGSNTTQQGNSRQNQGQRQGSHNNTRPVNLNLNAEEQALIVMMRTARNNNPN